MNDNRRRPTKAAASDSIETAARISRMPFQAAALHGSLLIQNPFSTAFHHLGTGPPERPSSAPSTGRPTSIGLHDRQAYHNRPAPSSPHGRPMPHFSTILPVSARRYRTIPPGRSLPIHPRCALCNGIPPQHPVWRHRGRRGRPPGPWPLPLVAGGRAKRTSGPAVNPQILVRNRTSQTLYCVHASLIYCFCMKMINSTG